MRRFTDGEGRRWEAVVGRESWGALFAIFVPAAPGEEICETQLGAATWADAEHELDTMDDEALRELRRRSAPKRLE